MKRRKAVFITVEGLEGSGKSSVINFIKEFLERRKFTVRVFREPGSTDIGEQIRNILLDRKNTELSSHTELLLYLAARTQLIEEKLQKELWHHDVIICDRFFDSTIVYQGYGLGLGPVVERSVKMFCLGIKPNLTIVLDTPVEEGLERIKQKDRIEERPLSFHRKLRRGYLQLAKKYPARIKVVNARGSLDSIYPRVERVLNKKFKLPATRRRNHAGL